MSDLKAIELFAGYGGLAMAIEHVTGAKTVAMSEIEPAAIEVLGHRFPDAAALGDVTRIDWHRVGRALGPIDIVGGGSPCQDLSHAGQQAGMREGTRSGLWFSMLEGIRILRPRLVVWENVRGALSAEADSDLEPCPWCMGGAGDGEPPMRALGRVVADLASLGYVGGWVGLRAADVGAPHGRFRIFLCAWPASDSSCLGWDGRGGSTVAAGAQGRRGDEDTQAPADRYGPGLEGPQPATGRLMSDGCAPSDASGDGRDEGWPEPAWFIGGPDAPVGCDAVAHSGGDGLPWGPECDGEQVARVDGAGRLDADGRAVHPGDWGPYAPAIARWERVLGRPVPNPTEPGVKGQPRLSPVFVEWLMGLPEGWVTDVPGISRNDQLKMLGNGVVWQQAAAGIPEVIRRVGLVVTA